jgi:hypothetical protein
MIFVWVCGEMFGIIIGLVDKRLMTWEIDDVSEDPARIWRN